MKGKKTKQENPTNSGNPVMVSLRPRSALCQDRPLFPVFYLPSAIFCLLLASCSITQPHVPVIDRAPPQKLAGKPSIASGETSKFYTVQKGDTLYGIALNHGLGYKELAEWNNIDNPNAIDIGQQLNLSPPAQPAQPSLFALSEPAPPTLAETAVPKAVAEPEGKFVANTDKLKIEPKALKLPYSEQAMAQLQGLVDTPPTLAAQTEPAAEKIAKVKSEPQPQTTESTAGNQVEWIWPAKGKVLEGFSESSKGVDIAGKLGQPVLAAAAGKVVYSGTGLRGYGNLIIVKHNDTYLSAYAHNSKLLVKEGQTVTRGQKIAEMGNSDTELVKLHFEIRMHGKPVDPLKHLPIISG